jgi:hypothetical protein
MEETPKEFVLTPISNKLKDAIRCNKTKINSNNGIEEFSESSLNKLENTCLEITFNELYFTKDEKGKIKNIIVHTLCPKKDKFTFYLNDFLEDKENNSLKLKNSKCKCYEFHLKDNLNEYYCIYDNQIICENYKSEHLNHNRKNYLIDKDKYDSFCLIHILKYSYYCSSCKLNLCTTCKEQHNKNCKIEEIKSINQCYLHKLKQKIEIAKNDLLKMNSFISKALSICKMKSLFESLNLHQTLNWLIINYAENILDITIQKQKSSDLNYQILFNFFYLNDRFQNLKFSFNEKNEDEFLRDLSKFVKNPNNFILKLKFEDEINDNENYENYIKNEDKFSNIPNGQTIEKEKDFKIIVEEIYNGNDFNNNFLSKSCNFVKHYKDLLYKDKEKTKEKKNGN